MNVELMKPRASQSFLEPTLEFPLTLSYDGSEAPLEISGLLATEDGASIAPLLEVRQFGAGSAGIGHLGARGTNHDKDLDRIKKRDFSLVAWLSRTALDHIDTVRNKNKKRDVVFKVSTNVRAFKSTSVVPPLHLIAPSEIGPPLREPLERENRSLVAYRFEPEYNPRVGNLCLISGSGGPFFLSLEDHQSEVTATVSASDWIHDFAPRFGLGRFVLVELPVPGAVADGRQFSKALAKAAEALQEVEVRINDGEWSEAVAKSRPVFELLRYKDMIKTIFHNHGIQEEAGNSLLAAVDSLFEYGSKFIHKVDKDRKTVSADASAEKEDAYLVYALSANLVNLLTRKLAKTNGSQTQAT